MCVCVCIYIYIYIYIYTALHGVADHNIVVKILSSVRTSSFARMNVL